MKRFVQTIIVLISALLCQCATKTDPSYLPAATSALFGGAFASPMGAQASPGRAASTGGRYYGARDFFND